MGRIYRRRRGGTWHAYWTGADGVAHRRSLRTRDQDTARVRLRDLELATTDPAAYSGHTLGEAIKGLERAMIGAPAGTISCYTQRARVLVQTLGAGVRLADLKRDRLVEYIRQRVDDHEAHPHTVAKELVVLRRAMTEARDRKLWTGDPRSIVPSIRTRYRPRERWLTRAEAAALLAVLPPHRRLWTAIGIYAGLRDSEIERLQWENVDLVRGTLRAPGHKTAGAWRRIPIAPELAMLLDQHAEAAGPVVMPWASVRRDLSIAMTTAIEGAPRRRRKAMEIGADRSRPRPAAAHVTPNDLRRTFASWLIQAGVDHLVVAHLLGHSSTRMVDAVYGRMSEDTYRAAIDRTFGAVCSPCAAAPPVGAAYGGSGEAAGVGIPSHLLQVVVPRDGVEPPTRGFSVRGRSCGRLRSVK